MVLRTCGGMRIVESFAKLGELARELGFKRTLIVSDRGLVALGMTARAAGLLAEAGIDSCMFSDFEPNPDSSMVEAGRIFAASQNIDSIVALGGGSSLDTAKGINFVLTNGGTMRGYRGFGKASRPMLPSIGIPTTAGTGSEAQSYALISDAETHSKMACGDPKAMFRAVILDPELTVTQPRSVTASAGYDAISHAVESFVTAKRTESSAALAREAWRLLEANYERVLIEPMDIEGRRAMLVGAHNAGAAIEQSMLGATHACANPLTAHYGTIHAVAIAVMLQHVVRWNSEMVGGLYRELYSGDLPKRLDELAQAGELPRTLREISVPRADLPALASDAAKEWTGSFNPRPFDAAVALYLYEQAY
ncbi:MAG: iron-containing alcohol dehydrogenase [Acidobacteria bacterium]|nr:iron-containing alcohol dehydrogenase [Acidobacteriota bacterium]